MSNCISHSWPFVLNLKDHGDKMALNTTFCKSILGASYNFSANKSLSESKCTLSVNYPLSFEDLVRKKVKIVHP